MENIVKTSKIIRSHAQKLLEQKKVENLLKEMGEIFYTGSYALDLMTWNDIDMQVIIKEGISSIEALSSIFRCLALDPDFIEAQLIHFKGGYKPRMPRGLYLGVQMHCPDLGGLWKLDIWSLSKPDFEKNQMLIKELQMKLNEENRKLILEIKNEMMQESGRVPQMGSHFLYQAVLLEGIQDKKDIYAYCTSRGVPLRQ